MNAGKKKFLDRVVAAKPWLTSPHLAVGPTTVTSVSVRGVTTQLALAGHVLQAPIGEVGGRVPHCASACLQMSASWAGQSGRGVNPARLRVMSAAIGSKHKGPTS